jgi:hypothetical protein
MDRLEALWNDLRATHLYKRMALALRRDLRGQDLSGWDLSRRGLNSADLAEARLVGAVLRKAQLAGANLANADFTGADLTRVCLRGANLSGARLTDAKLYAADFSGTVLKGTRLDGAGYDWRTRWPDGFDANEHGALLRSARAAFFATVRDMELEALMEAARDAGYAEVSLHATLPELEPVTGDPKGVRRYPETWRSVDVLMLDDSIGEQPILECLERTRLDPDWSPARILLLRDSPDEVIFRFWARCPDCTLIKPVIASELQTFLERILESR